MRLSADRAEAHRACRETLDDLGGWLDFVERQGLAAVFRCVLDAEQAADRRAFFRIAVHHLRELGILFRHIAAHRMLQCGDVVRVPGMAFPAHAVGIFAADIKEAPQHLIVAESGGMTLHGFQRDLRQRDTFNGGGGAGEITVHELARQADRVENLRAAIGLVGGDAHLGHDLEQALVDRLDVAFDNLGRIHLFGKLAAPVHVCQRLEGQIGVDCFGTIACKAAEMMHFARFARFDNQTDRGAQPLPDQMVMHGCRCKQCRNGDAVRAKLAVGEDDDVVAACHGCFGTFAQPLKRTVHTVRTFLRPISDVDGLGVETIFSMADGTDLLQITIGENRLAYFEPLAPRRTDQIENVGPWSDEGDEAHHQFFSDRIYRRVGYLREVLLEIGVEQLGAIRHGGDRRVGAH